MQWDFPSISQYDICHALLQNGICLTKNRIIPQSDRWEGKDLARNRKNVASFASLFMENRWVHVLRFQAGSSPLRKDLKDEPMSPSVILVFRYHLFSGARRDELIPATEWIATKNSFQMLIVLKRRFSLSFDCSTCFELDQVFRTYVFKYRSGTSKNLHVLRWCFRRNNTSMIYEKITRLYYIDRICSRLNLNRTLYNIQQAWVLIGARHTCKNSKQKEPSSIPDVAHEKNKSWISIHCSFWRILTI